MRRIVKAACACFLAALCLCAPVAPALAASSVSYQGHASDFIVTPGSAHSPTDLFGQFEGAMPGDTLTQAIEVRNDASDAATIKVYMRALGGEEASAALLSQLKLTVAQRGQSTLFEAAADQKGGLADWVLLGTLAAGEREILDVKLELPITLGNEFQDAAGRLQWQFKVDEIPETDPDPTPEATPTATPATTPDATKPPQLPGENPRTGDASRVALWLGLMAASLAGLAAIVLARKWRGGRPDQ